MHDDNISSELNRMNVGSEDTKKNCVFRLKWRVHL